MHSIVTTFREAVIKVEVANFGAAMDTLIDEDVSTRWPLKGNSEVHLHTPTKFGEDPSKDLGGVGEQTNKQTDKRCSIYSMMIITIKTTKF